jgi:hypothetical protein
MRRREKTTTMEGFFAEQNLGGERPAPDNGMNASKDRNIKKIN